MPLDWASDGDICCYMLNDVLQIQLRMFLQCRVQNRREQICLQEAGGPPVNPRGTLLSPLFLQVLGTLEHYE